jgi:tetratricopeptide (TPR) repeat protein
MIPTGFRHSRALAIALTAGLLVGGAALGARAEESDGKNTVRLEIGKPLQDAQKLIADRKYKEALAKVQQADGVRDKTAYESFVLEEIRGAAARGAGDMPTAIRSFEAVVATNRLPPPDQLRYVQSLAVSYYTVKDYPQAIAWSSRYLKQGGTDGQVHTLLAQSYYLAGDYAGATAELKAQVAAAERAGQSLPESALTMLADSALKQKDDAGYSEALQRLVAAYPRTEYWLPLLHQIERAPGFAGRLQLDLDRIKLATGTLRGSGDYLDMAQLALAGGLPGEARKIVEQGYAAGILGSGADAERHRRLRDLAEKSAAEDRNTLDKGIGEAAAQKDGGGLVNTGLDYLGYGETEKGVGLIERGIEKGNLRRPEDGKLHLGLAYIAAGQKAKAIAILKTVQGSDGTADIARAWILFARAST